MFKDGAQVSRIVAFISSEKEQAREGSGHVTMGRVILESAVAATRVGSSRDRRKKKRNFEE